jgi:hypothetical protein
MEFGYREQYPYQQMNMDYFLAKGGEHELAQAYIPFQRYVTSFPPKEALRMGTMFPELVRPYHKCKV